MAEAGWMLRWREWASAGEVTAEETPEDEADILRGFGWAVIGGRLDVLRRSRLWGRPRHSGCGQRQDLVSLAVEGQ